MAFWKGETLEARLPALITPPEAYDPKRIDCAAYTLRLGSDVFVTSDLPDVGGPHEGVKTQLSLGQQIRINPGQFAFLSTEETVEVPDTAIAFISMKATFKLRGLINVSGFHVDPGWKDPLLFAVYNAGPSPVILARGMQLFLIWYADLDGKTEKIYEGDGKSIDATLISNMSGQVFSPTALKKDMGRLSDKVGGAKDGLVKLEASVSTLWKLGSTAVGLAIAAGLYLNKEQADLKRELAARLSSQPKIEQSGATLPASGGKMEKNDKKADKK